MPEPPSPSEPENLAETIFTLGLSHVVITSPTRDDLDDGGASHYAACIDAIHKTSPDTKIETLVPDFKGSDGPLKTVLDAKPDILSHNLETVKRLYAIRKGADYHQSLDLLQKASEYAPEIPTKSGIMAGLGETDEEVFSLCEDLLGVNCKMLSIGQYLSPKKDNYPVKKFISPEKFVLYKQHAMNLGFSHVESGPYVRSSYNAENYLS